MKTAKSVGEFGNHQLSLRLASTERQQSKLTPIAMTILLTGGTGKTSSRIAPRLKQQGTPCIMASRSGSAPDGFTGCRFDWLDESTFDSPFKLASDIAAVYMVAPVAEDHLAAMKPITDFAISKGVKRFVLLTSSAVEVGGPAYGKVHEYLVQKGVDYGVLRPTWFMGMYGRFKPSEMSHTGVS